MVLIELIECCFLEYKNPGFGVILADAGIQMELIWLLVGYKEQISSTCSIICDKMRNMAFFTSMKHFSSTPLKPHAHRIPDREGLNVS